MEDKVNEIFDDNIGLRVTCISEKSGVNLNSLQVCVHLHDLRFCNFSDEDIFAVVKTHMPNVIGMFSNSNCFSLIRKINEDI